MDTFRFLAALWVVFSHCGRPPLDSWIGRSNSVELAVHGIYGNFFGAVPAVIVFFLISGFCIHYPYRQPNSFELGPYLGRRYIRIGVPLIAAMLLASPFHVGLSFFQNSVLWSLVAELIFYSLYPFLRVLHARFGWNKIIVVSYAVSFAAIGIFNPSAKDYAPSGNALNWLICLPYWLLGCRLAEENFAVRPAISGRVLWQWRLGVALAAWTCNALRFHSAIGYPWSLGVFAILLFFWLRVEITAFCCKKPFRLLEWAGQWSYSIYLMHLIAVSLFGKISLPDLGIIANWILTTGFVLVFCYAFYLLIEKPSHGIARWAGKALRKPSQVILPPSSGRPVPAQSTSGSLRSPD